MLVSMPSSGLSLSVFCLSFFLFVSVCFSLSPCPLFSACLSLSLSVSLCLSVSISPPAVTYPHITNRSVYAHRTGLWNSEFFLFLHHHFQSHTCLTLLHPLEPRV